MRIRRITSQSCEKLPVFAFVGILFVNLESYNTYSVGFPNSKSIPSLTHFITQHCIYATLGN